MEHHLHVTLAGGLTVRRGTRELGDSAFPGRQLRLVTAMLVLKRADPVAFDTLADELWPDTPPTRWRVALSGLVGKVRKAAIDLGLPPDAIVARAGAYRVDLGVVRVDLEQAASLVRQAHVHLAAGRVEQALDDANMARAVLSRPVLPGVRSDWLDGVRDRVASQHVDALVALGAGRSHLGRHDQARLVLAHAVESSPFREDAWRALMRMEAAAGNTGQALRVYERCRRHLVDELGVDPSAATQRLHGMLLADLPTPDEAHTLRERNHHRTEPDQSGRSVHSVTPYVGLRAFQRTDADLFFGRDGDVQEVLTRLQRSGIVAVVGPSGVGKSSMVLAGLLPALERGAIPDSDTWVPVLATPGAAPVKALAVRLAELAPDRFPGDLASRLQQDPEALHSVVQELLADQPAGARVLLVIDQLEELFTLGDRDQAARLVAQLTAATRRLDSRVVVVVTLRADFYDQAAAVPGLARLLSSSQFVVPPLQGDQVAEVIRQPAQQSGTTLESGLLARIIADFAGRPGTLPLLQHLLWELWQHRTGRLMTLDAYAGLGGVTGALARRAESVYAALGTDERAHVRRVLLRGVQPDEDGANARRPIPESEWGVGNDGPAGAAVVSRLVESRLLTATRDPATGQRLVELAHEALIDGWPRLRDWVDQARGWLLDVRRLSMSATDWERHGRDDDWLLSGSRLDEAEEVTRAGTRHELDLHVPPLVHALVDASVEVRASQQRRDLARRRAASIRSVVSEARAALVDDPERALLLALVAAEQQDDVRVGSVHGVDNVLHRAVAAQRERSRFPDVGELLAVHPRGYHFVTAQTDPASDQEASFAVRDATTGEQLRTLPAARDAYVTAAFDPTGSLLITGVNEPRLRVWRTSDGAELATLRAAEESALAVWSVDPTGRYVVAGDIAHLRSDFLSPSSHVEPDGSVEIARSFGLVHVWDLGSGDVVRSIERPPWLAPDDPGPCRGCFSPDGTLLALSIWARRSSARIIDLETAECLFELPPEQGVLTNVAWSPDGRWLAVGGDRVTVIDVPERRVQTTWAAKDGLSTGLAWAADSKRLFVGTRSVQRWNAPLGVCELTYRAGGRFGPNTQVFTTKDGRQVFTGSRTGATVRIWDASPDAGAELARIRTDDNPSLAWSPNGRRLAVSRPNGCALIDTGSWQDVTALPTRLKGDRLLAWSQDGSTLVAGHGEGAVAWNPDSGAELFRLEPDVGTSGPAPVCVSPDGRHLAAAEWVPPGENGVWAGGYRLRILDPDGLEIRRLERSGQGWVLRMQYSPDGSTIAVARYGGLFPMAPVDCGIDLWDPTAETRRTLDTIGLDVAFDPTGRRLVTAGLDGRAEIWNLHTGKLESTLDGHGDVVATVTWSPDGQWIGTGGHDATVRTWSAVTGEPALQFELEAQQPVTQVAFSPDGRRLAGGQEGQGIWIWTLDRSELIQIAQKRATRQLSRVERREYLDPHDWPDQTIAEADRARATHLATDAVGRTHPRREGRPVRKDRDGRPLRQG
jgi:WD40 repeat protein/DNA-binding SARP family transcriptional activator